MLDDTSSQGSSHSGTYSNLDYYSVNEQEPSTSPRRGYQHASTTSHMCTRFCPGEAVHNWLPSMDCNCCKQWGVSQGSTCKGKGMVDNRRLTRNRSLVDTSSQLLHRSLVEEVNKRRLFKTVGAVENIGFQAPCEVSKMESRPSKQKNRKILRWEMNQSLKIC